MTKQNYGILTAALCVFTLGSSSYAQSNPDPQAILSQAKAAMSQIPAFKAEVSTPSKEIKTIQYFSNKDNVIRTRVEMYSRVLGAGETPIIVQIQNGNTTWSLLPGKALKMEMQDKLRSNTAAAVLGLGKALTPKDNNAFSVKSIEDSTGKYYLVTEQLAENDSVKQQLQQTLQAQTKSPIALPTIASEETLIGQDNHFVYRTTLRDSSGNALYNNELSNVDFNPNMPDSLFEVPKDSKIYIVQNGQDYLTAIKDKTK